MTTPPKPLTNRTVHETTAEIAALLQKWANGYRAKDAVGLLALVSGDEDVVMVGTGADEVCFGLAALRTQIARDFSQAGELDTTFSNLRVTLAGDAAAFAYCDVVVTGSVAGEAFAMSGLRLTAGLMRTAQGWRFAQMHLSAPNGAQDEGRSFQGL